MKKPLVETAPMNRSYAIKYAREKGYKYLVQLDDNIVGLQIAYKLEKDGIKKTYRCCKATTNEIAKEMANDFIDMMICVLENTNAGMAGLNMSGAGMPGDDYLAERYCYSFFALKLDVVPDHFQGDFEDDVEFRLRLAKLNIPAVQV